MTTSLLVFGGNGQLAQEIGALGTAQGVPVRLVLRSECDISDEDAVVRMISSHRPTVVVNAAAYTKVDEAERRVDDAFRVNEAGTAMLAKACGAMGIPMIHVSTDYVFDGTKQGAYVEDDPISPANVYGRSKAAGEVAVRALCERYVILRSSWLYGIYGANFLKTIVRAALERNELRVVADQRGCPTGTADLAAAILIAGPRLAAEPAVAGIYHVAGTGVTTWHGFATEIVAAQAPFTCRHPPVRMIETTAFPTPARRPANSELDSSRFAATFGFRAEDWRARTRQVVKRLLS
jgi:dTDP-4-dehydrorhamnose reductase